MSFIPYGRQSINEADIQAVINVLKSDFLTQGSAVPKFEKTVSDYCRSQYAIAVNSATSALHLACLALSVGKRDIVWTSPITFVASANCALYCGASIDFVDINPRTYNMSVEQLEIKLIKAKQNNKLPKVVIPVHLCGQSCEMERIHQLGQQYGFSIIEDAAHAIGGKYKGQPIGNCHYSDITVFSFHPVKIITTGEGGMALTNNKKLADKMTLLRSHGITRNPELMTHNPDGAWYYQQIDLGFNYRMTDIQAALGISQMQRLDEFVTQRHELAKRYDKLLMDLPITLPWQHPNSYSSFHLYVIRLQLDTIQLTHQEVFDALRQQGIGVNLHYIPVHMQPYYQAIGFDYGGFPTSERYYQEAISLPMFSAMTDEQQKIVCLSLTKIIQA
ncbi:MAG: UDP-4-amino-4,6-dideoxy-N-acetyl-beta-L-altrosamine transaminase [bacterium]